MQQEPQADTQSDHVPDADNAALPAGRRQGLGLGRPAAQALDDALRKHREDATDIEKRNALLVLLYRAVAHQASGLVARQFRALAHREDELVLRTMARIEARETAERADEAAPPPLLADYAFGPGSRAIYNYVQQKTLNIARNMQVEAYVPDGGFWSRDLKEQFRALRLAHLEGHAALRGGERIEVAIDVPDDDDGLDARSGRVPEGLRLSETPMRQSVLRVNSLARKLELLAQGMVGQTVVTLADDGAVLSETRLTVNHQRLWRAWLGLSHPELIDLGEEDLAAALGLSKATVTRDTSAAFAYMLQQSDLRALLVLMEPNRFNSSASATKELETKMDELENALRGRNGKSFFRKCVHQWLGEHA